MNETASDSESPNSDSETQQQRSQQAQSLPSLPKVGEWDFRPNFRSGMILMKTQVQASEGHSSKSSGEKEESFFAKQARLQAEARQALAQAKEVARVQLIQVGGAWELRTLSILCAYYAIFFFRNVRHAPNPQ